MGACCQTNSEELKTEVIIKNTQDKRSATPTPASLTPAPLNTNENEDKALKKEVEDIWKKYDINNNGVLDKKEAYAFLDDMMKEVTGQAPTQEEIESNFRILDEDQSGDVSKEEAFKFIKGYRIGHSLREMLMFASD